MSGGAPRSPARYITGIFKSINANAKCLPEDSVTRLLEYIRDFYISLFQGEKGVFRKSKMDKKLCKPAAPRPKIQQRLDPDPSTSTSCSEPPPKRKGLGKGSPNMPRKDKVSKRQVRLRVGKRKAAETSTTPPVIAPKRSASHFSPPRLTSTPQRRSLIPLPTVPSPPSPPTLPSSSPSPPPPPPPNPAQPREARQELLLQVNRESGERRVALIQELSEAGKGNPINATELEYFWREMDHWGKLDRRIIDAMSTVWSEVLSNNRRGNGDDNYTLQQILTLDGMSNGVKNCTQHLVGLLVQDAFQHSKRTNVQWTMEEMETSLRRMQYQEYVQALERCGCQSCEDVLSFDQKYKRYYDLVEEDQEVDANSPVPIIADRPKHCNELEPCAQTLKSKYSGRSVSSLQRAFYFAMSTPPFSPPAISTGIPTHVQEITQKYMQQFLKERKLQDVLPSSWMIESNPILVEHLVPLDKSSIHFYDGDSAEITAPPSGPLASLATPPKNVIRIRMLNHDAPEMKFAVRIYKQPDGSTCMQRFATRHLGLESLRAVRQIVFEARTVYLEVPRDSRGNLMVQLDFYGRRLMNIFVETSNGDIENLAEILAFTGNTLSFYTTGIHNAVNTKMRNAMSNKRGMFSLPEEVFSYPFLPWDLRKLWLDPLRVPQVYEEYSSIFNAPEQPELVWRAQEEENDAELEDSQRGDSFFFRIVPSTMQHESLCFVAKSTIEGAGAGLFLKPHGSIPRGTHLCIYALQQTCEEEINTSGSSRDYAVNVSRTGSWFDAETQEANNLGRFVNQPMVLEMLQEIRKLSDKQAYSQISDFDWKPCEDRLQEHCNGVYKTVNGQLMLFTSCDLPATGQPQEIFTSYGGLRSYWINAISASPHKYPKALSDIVEWLLKSTECNWTDEQREKWSTR